jgi:threonine/homoserine/homoserine lactone efflux protein
MRFLKWTSKALLALLAVFCLFCLAGTDVAYALVRSVYSGLGDGFTVVLLAFVTAFVLMLALVVASYFVCRIMWRQLRPASSR